MQAEVVTYERDGDVALIGLNRPEKRNAMNGALFDQLLSAALRAQAEASCLVVFAHGPHFSAGLDLRYASEELLRDIPRHGMRRQADPFDLLARGDIPVVTALSGAVVGAGFELAAASHVRVADETAFFGLPEAQRGIFVGGGGSVRIQRLIGYGRMADMMLTGRLYNAEQALDAGAVQYLTPPGGAVDMAMTLARRIAQNAPRTNWAVVNALPRIADVAHEEGLFIERMTAHFVSASPDADARLREFVEKRAEPLEVPEPKAGIS